MSNYFWVVFAICTFFSGGAGTKGVLCVCVVHKQRGVRKEGSQQCGGVRSREKLKADVEKSESKRKYSPLLPLLFPSTHNFNPQEKKKKYNALQHGINPAAVW